MAKFLDDNGLLYLWSKIKAIIPKKTSDLTNDSGFITSADVPEGAAASTTTPKMAGTAAVGSETAFARGDHVHPSDTTKVDKVEGKGLSTNDLTDALLSKFNGKQDPATTLSGYGITDAYTKSEVDAKLTSAVTYKGTIASYSALPTSGNSVGDMYNITAADSANGIKAGDNVVWNGSSWDVQSGTVDLSGCVQITDTITNAEIDTIVAS